MKKIYLNLVALSLISLSANAQRTADLHNFAPLKETAKVTPSGRKAPATAANYQTKVLNTVWSDDFTGGTNPNETAQGQWTTGGLNASYWSIGTAAHPLSAFGWTTAMTGKYLGWDSYNNVPDETPDFAVTQVNGVIESPSISYTATNSVGIQFETEAMYCCNFNYTPFGISVSTDNGTSWSDTLYFDFFNTSADTRNEATEDIAHPLTVTQNLQSIAPAGSQGTFKFRFVWDGNDADGNGQYNSHYFWLIDNVELFEIPSTEMELVKGWQGDVVLDWEYSMIPLSQTREIRAGVIVKNNGATAQTTVVSSTVHNASGVVATPAAVTSATIPVGSSDTVWINTGYTPSANGVYHVEFTIPSDDIPGNDAVSTSTLTVNADVMAHDYGSSLTYGWNPASSTPEIADIAKGAHGWGEIYVTTVNETVYGMDIFLGSTTTPNIYLEASVFEYDLSLGVQGAEQSTTPGDWVQKAVEIVNTATAGIGVSQHIEFSTPFTMTAGKGYLFQILKPDVTTTERFTVAGSAGNNEDDDFSTVAYGPLSTTPGNFNFTDWGNSLFIRASFKNTAGLTETGMEGISIYPNPTEGKLTVTNTNNYDNIIEVVNLAGTVVYTGTSNTTVSLDLTGKGAGVYFVNISNELGSVTEKVILK